MQTLCRNVVLRRSQTIIWIRSRRWLWRHINTHTDTMLTTADEHTLDRAHVAVVAPPGDRHVRIVHKAVVRGIEVDPTEPIAPGRAPGVGGIGANEPLLTRRR